MVMKKADDSMPLGGLVQVDDVYWGGKKSGGKRGRGAPGKTPFIAALQRNEAGHPVFMRLSRVGSYESAEMLRWAKHHLSPESVVVSDGLACFKSVEKTGHIHYPIKTTGRYNTPNFRVFDWLNTVIGNVKNAVIGTYHGMSHRHLPRYLGEFCYRFNRRFRLPLLLTSLIVDAVNSDPIPQHVLSCAEDWW